MTTPPLVRVLLIDDDEDDRILAQDMLREIGTPRYAITCAADYESALAHAGEPFDVCLVDYRLGPRNGLELIRELAARGCRAPAILLTGQSDRAIDVQAMEAGALDYLVKGQTTAPVLERSIRYAIEHQQVLEALRGSHEQLEQAYRELRDHHAQLLQSARLASVGQLAAGVAHEINNPMMVILGFTQSLLRRIPKDDPAAFPLASIERESIRVRDLVRNLLVFSRQNELPETVFQAGTVIADALALIEAMAASRGVEIRREIPDAPFPLRGAATQIQQVLINLCANALDAMPNGGMLTVRAGRVEKDGKPWIRLEVADTGSGIPSEIRERIFDPFFTTKEPGRGTGLGLSLASEIVRRHLGRIALETEVGRGTRFDVLLPDAGAADSKGGTA
jgi:two-component system, sensor histidine kinase and response regulator